MLDWRGNKIPLTRENFVELDWPDAPNPLPPEYEASLPERFKLNPAEDWEPDENAD